MVNGWELVRLTWHVQQTIFAEAEAELARLQLTPKAMAVLAIATMLPFPNDIAQSLGTPASTISNYLRDLEKAGYIRRELATHDRRRISIVITAAGQAALNEAIEVVNEHGKARLAVLSEVERRELVRLLTKVTLTDGA